MATPTNHWKLGLFVIIGFVLALSTVVFLGAASLKKKVVSYHTYFDESVQGLEVGSAVKYRGVIIGIVSAIDIAPDRRRVGVTSDLAVKDLKNLRISDGKGSHLRIHIPPDLRAQLASQGITGVKFMQMDFFPEKDNPRPALPFPEPENYIPAAVSTMKNLEDAIVRAVNRIPEIADGVLKVTTSMGTILQQVEEKKIPENAMATLAKANEVLTTLQKAVKEIDIKHLSGKAQAALVSLDKTALRATALLAHVDGEKGLLASTQRATQAVGDVAGGARGLGREVEETLRDIQEVTASIQRIADALERDPDMLLKGRSKSRRGTP